MMRLDAPPAEAVPTLRHGIWHLWGLAAPVTRADPPSPGGAASRSSGAKDRDLQVTGPRHLLESMDTVIVPTYWGAVRQQQLALSLVAAELNPYVMTLAEAVIELDPGTVPHSILVEVEPTRVCVTRLTGPHIASRMTHLVGADDAAALVETVIALAYQLTVYADEPMGMPDDVEITGGRGITEYPPRWQDEVEFIVAEVPPGWPQPHRGLLVDRLRDRSFLAFELPTRRLVDVPVGTGAQRHQGQAESSQYAEHSEEPEYPETSEQLETSEWSPDAVGAAGLFAAARRARLADEVGRRKTSGPGAATMQGSAVPLAVIGGVVLLVVMVGVIALLAGSSRGTSASSTAVNAGERVARGADSQLSAVPSIDDLPSDANAATSDVSLAEAGVEASFPAGWEKDPTSPLDRMIVTDGGEMRVVLLSHQLAPEVNLDYVVAGLSSHSAADATKSPPQRTQLRGTDVVMVEERLPSGKSVVLWYHKIVDGKQVSVGCQFRGTAIPAERPVCDQAVLSARPISPG